MKFIFYILLLSITLLSKESTPISLQLAWKYQFQFAGYIMAKEKGYFEELGLNVKLKEYQHDKIPVDEVSKGLVQFGIGRSNLLLERLNKNTKILQLLALCQHSPVVLQTVKENNITKISDLKGKKLLMYGSKNEASIISMLYSVGIDEDDMIRVQAKTYQPNEIVNGTADVVTGYSTITPYHLKKIRIYSY